MKKTLSLCSATPLKTWCESTAHVTRIYIYIYSFVATVFLNKGHDFMTNIFSYILSKDYFLVYRPPDTGELLHNV